MLTAQQVSVQQFESALRELGHNPDEYRGKRLSLRTIQSIYGIEENTIIDAIDNKFVAAHYDYMNDVIWVDALDAAHYYYCVLSEKSIHMSAMK